MPDAAPSQAMAMGHFVQSGRLGVQIVAPRSISACAMSPGRSRAISFCDNSRNSGLASGKGVSTDQSRAVTRSILPSSGMTGRLNAIAPTAAAVYGPMPGRASSPSTVSGKTPPDCSVTAMAHLCRLRARA